MVEIEAARARIEDLRLLSPLVSCDAAPQGRMVRLKLESLQPVGSFKIRPIANAVLSRPRAALNSGIYTTSTGNSALGVAWMARILGIAATAVVPVNASETKLDQLRGLGTRIDMRPSDVWWRAIETGVLDDQRGVYIDAVRDPASLAGDATIGLEILSQWPEVEAILVPFGGGGLACGIACAAHDPGFVSGVGFGTVLPEMWPLVKSLIDGVITVSLRQVAEAIKLMVERNHVVAEGAGAVAVAAALSGNYTQNKVCAVVSGGNLDGQILASILQGRMPN
jgi:threonine dehydratase